MHAELGVEFQTEARPEVSRAPAAQPGRFAESGSDATHTARPQISGRRAAARDADSELAARFERYQSELDVSVEHADLLTGSRGLANFFEAALREHAHAPDVAAWIVNDLRGLLGDRSLGDLPFNGGGLGRLAGLVAEGGVSRRAAKDILARMVEEGGEPAELVEAMGLGKVTDEAALGSVVDDVLGAWPKEVDAYRNGKRKLIGLFVGEVMKATAGAADPQSARNLLAERLDG